jgi:hypothetical protein
MDALALIDSRIVPRVKFTVAPLPLVQCCTHYPTTHDNRAAGFCNLSTDMQWVVWLLKSLSGRVEGIRADGDVTTMLYRGDDGAIHSLGV